MTTIGAMPKKKPQKDEGSKAPADARQRKMYEVRQPFIGPLQQLMVRLGNKDLTECINQLVREGLERHHLWPPKPDPESPA